VGKIAPNLSTVVDALRHYADAGAVTVKEIARWAGVADRTVYAWLAASEPRGGPDSVEVNLILQKAPADVRYAVAVAQLAGSGLVVDTDPGDAGAGCLRTASLSAVTTAAAVAAGVNDALADGEIDPAEWQRIKGQVIAARATLDDLLACEPRRLRVAR
jgi:hypothetical protein